MIGTIITDGIVSTLFYVFGTILTDQACNYRGNLFVTWKIRGGNKLYCFKLGKRCLFDNRVIYVATVAYK